MSSAELKVLSGVSSNTIITIKDSAGEVDDQTEPCKPDFDQNGDCVRFSEGKALELLGLDTCFASALLDLCPSCHMLFLFINFRP